MFFLTILLVYSLSTIYTYLRLRKLSFFREHSTGFTLFYIVLVLGGLLPEIVFHHSSVGSGPARYILLTGYFTLTFCLYLFLTVLVSDILGIVNRLLKIVPVEIIRGRKFQFVHVGVLFVLPVLIVVFGVVNMNTIRVNEYRVSVPRQSARIDHLKIAMAADFHLGQLTGKDFPAEFAARVNALAPDILLIPGDMVEGHRDDGDIAEFARHFREIKAKYGIYASPGNHDSHGMENTSEFFENAGITLLEDSGVVIDNSFYLVGRNDQRSNNRKNIDVLLAHRPDRLPVIVLDHRPIFLEQVSRRRVDIQLSGHTHYGQLFPINLIIDGLYELGWGYKKIGNTHFFVTSGIRLWGPPVRTAGDSEIMVINVDFIPVGNR